LLTSGQVLEEQTKSLEIRKRGVVCTHNMHDNDRIWKYCSPGETKLKSVRLPSTVPIIWFWDHCFSSCGCLKIFHQNDAIPNVSFTICTLRLIYTVMLLPLHALEMLRMVEAFDPSPHSRLLLARCPHMGRACGWKGRQLMTSQQVNIKLSCRMSIDRLQFLCLDVLIMTKPHSHETLLGQFLDLVMNSSGACPPLKRLAANRATSLEQCHIREPWRISSFF